MLYIPNCTYCKHLGGPVGKMTCKAFPEEIPDEQLYGLHIEVVEGQKGKYVFEEKEEKKEAND